jgi:uncharacterized membrane protein YkoI
MAALRAVVIRLSACVREAERQMTIEPRASAKHYRCINIAPAPDPDATAVYIPMHLMSRTFTESWRCRTTLCAPPSSSFTPENSMRITHLTTLAFLAVAATTAGAQGPKHHKKVETQAQLQQEARMTMADARALALRTVPNATIQAGEIEREGGKLIYSFDMKTAGKSGIDEVNIDAMSGKVIAKQHETPKDEKAEAKADAKAAKAKP